MSVCVYVDYLITCTCNFTRSTHFTTSTYVLHNRQATGHRILMWMRVYFSCVFMCEFFMKLSVHKHEPNLHTRRTPLQPTNEAKVYVVASTSSTRRTAWQTDDSSVSVVLVTANLAHHTRAHAFLFPAPLSTTHVFRAQHTHNTTYNKKHAVLIQLQFLLHYR